MKADKGLGKQLQDTAAAAVGAEKISFQRLERVQPRHVLTLLATAAAALSSTRSPRHVTCRPSSPGWTGAGPSRPRVASAPTYAGAGLELVGGFAQRPSLGLTTAVQLGGSFINRITPVKVGGMAVNVRYLQKQGRLGDRHRRVDRRGGGRGHPHRPHRRVPGVAGSKTDIVKFPSSSTILLVLVIVAAAIGLWWSDRPGDCSARWSSPRSRRPPTSCARPFRGTLARLSLSFLGALFMDLAYIAALFASVRAFHYPVTRAVAAAPPAPSWPPPPQPPQVGMVRVALIAGLTATGVPSELAVSAVLIDRVATFWLPVLPGWLAFTLLTRRDGSERHARGASAFAPAAVP